MREGQFEVRVQNGVCTAKCGCGRVVAVEIHMVKGRSGKLANLVMGFLCPSCGHFAGKVEMGEVYYDTNWVVV